MNNNAIETLSVSAVKDSIVKSSYLEEFIEAKDKGPSWDGYICVYKTAKHTKENLVGRVHTQVKGAGDTSSKFNKINQTFPMSRVDLKNYLYGGGIILFVVDIDARYNKTIYYEALTPIKLKNILEEGKNKVYENIKLKHFPENDNSKVNIFFNFLTDAKKQNSFVDRKLYSLEELQKNGVLESVSFSISGMGINKQNIYKELAKQEVYMYANIKGIDIPQPLGLPGQVEVGFSKPVIVSSNGKEFYSKCQFITTKDSYIVEIGSSFKIEMKDGAKACTLHYKLSNKLRILIKDLEFMLAVVEGGKFELDGIEFPVNSNVEIENFNIKKQKANLQYYKKVLRVLDIFGIEDDIDFQKLEKQDFNLIDWLIKAFVDNEPISNIKSKIKPIGIVSVGGLKIIVSFVRVENKKDTYNLFDFFNTEYKVYHKDKNGEKVETSKYEILSVNNYLEISNLRLDKILPSYQSLSSDEEKCVSANTTMLKLLEAYDKSKKASFLKTAKEISEWLMDMNDLYLPRTIKILNRLQVIKRERELSIIEVSELCNVTENNESAESEKVAAYLLLDNQKAAEIHFNKLDKSDQKDFRGYPIYYFWKSEK